VLTMRTRSITGMIKKGPGSLRSHELAQTEHDPLLPRGGEPDGRGEDQAADGPRDSGEQGQGQMDLHRQDRDQSPFEQPEHEDQSRDVVKHMISTLWGRSDRETFETHSS
jgi:hypothetical protein